MGFSIGDTGNQQVTHCDPPFQYSESGDILPGSKPLTFGVNQIRKGTRGPDCDVSSPQQECATLSCHFKKEESGLKSN